MAAGSTALVTQAGLQVDVLSGSVRATQVGLQVDVLSSSVRTTQVGLQVDVLSGSARITQVGLQADVLSGSVRITQAGLLVEGRFVPYWPGKLLGHNTTFGIDDSTGTCRSFYDLGNHCALAYTTEAPDVTCFGDLVRQRLPDGLKNWELTFDAHFGSTTVTDADATLGSVVGGATRFCLGPTGSETGMLKYTACGVLTDYRLSFKPDGVGVISGTMIPRSGSLTRTTW